MNKIKDFISQNHVDEGHKHSFIVIIFLLHVFISDILNFVHERESY